MEKQQERFTLEESGYKLEKLGYQTSILLNMETGQKERFVRAPWATGFVVIVEGGAYAFHSEL